MKSAVTYWHSSTNSKSHYIIILLMDVVIYFVCLPLMFKSEDYSARLMIIRFQNLILSWIFVTNIQLLVTYVVVIRRRMHDMIGENVKLFDRIHEGLIVISDDNEQLQFANQPAISLLTRNTTDDQTWHFQESDLNTKIFQKTTFALNRA